MRASPADAISRIVQGVGVSWTRGQTETHAEFHRGSALAYRLLGFLTAARLMPIRVVIDAAPGPGGITRVTVQASSNEGWSAVPLSSLSGRLYARAFDELFRAVQDAIAPIAVDTHSQPAD